MMKRLIGLAAAVLLLGAVAETADAQMVLRRGIFGRPREVQIGNTLLHLGLAGRVNQRINLGGGYNTQPFYYGPRGGDGGFVNTPWANVGWGRSGGYGPNQAPYYGGGYSIPINYTYGYSTPITYQIPIAPPSVVVGAGASHQEPIVIPIKIVLDIDSGSAGE